MEKNYFIPIIECMEKELAEYGEFIEKEAKFLNNKGISCALIVADNPNLKNKSEKKQEKMCYFVREETDDDYCKKPDGTETPMQAKFKKYFGICNKETTTITKEWRV